MYLLYCDETNLPKQDMDFFVYGGLVVNGDAAHSMHMEIESLRRSWGLAPDAILKFNPRPDHLNHEQFKDLKQSVIEIAVRHQCVFLTSLILHNVSKGPEEARLNEINRIFYHFDCFLNRRKSHGLALVDRFDQRSLDSHLREKFSVGLKGMPFSGEMRLDRIIGFHYTAIGQAHFASVVDIILGSFRFAINAFTRNEEDKLASASTILRKLSPLFHRDVPEFVSDISLNWSPNSIQVLKYRLKYQDLSDFLASNNLPTSRCHVPKPQDVFGSAAAYNGYIGEAKPQN